MSRALPVLTKPVIEAELKRMCDAGRNNYLFAFYGEGSDQVVDLTEYGRFCVHPVVSELDLRQQMPALEEEKPKRVFLVPWTGDCLSSSWFKQKRRGQRPRPKRN